MSSGRRRPCKPFLRWPTMTAATPDDPYDALGPGIEVKRVRTPLSHAPLWTVLRIGHKEATGSDISPGRLRASWCMIAVESNGQPDVEMGHERIPGWSIWNNNLGNISAALKVHGVAWQGDWTPLTANENIDGGKMVTQRLRAHSSAIAGASDYWTCLLARFPEAVAAMDRGNLDGLDAKLPGVALALKMAKGGAYYTATERSYAAGLVAWARVYDARFT